MYPSKKTMLSHSRQCIRSGLFLLFGILLNGILLSGQTRQALGYLSQDGKIYRLNQTNHNNVENARTTSSAIYYDLIIPPAGNLPYLSFTARGGDGGKWYIRNLFGQTVRTGQGGQGALVKAVFKIGTGANELIPGSTIRVIVGQSGRSGTNCIGCVGSSGAGGGGGTGILYLPAGANENSSANWQILMAAGAGGGGWADTGGHSGNGNPGDITPRSEQDVDYFGHTWRVGGTTSYDNCGAGGGSDTTLSVFGTSNGDGTDWGNYSACCGGGGFQQVNGHWLPTGGLGGNEKNYGGYGFGGGGGSSSGSSQRPGAGGGGFYGGCPGLNYGDGDQGSGDGGGCYINGQYALPLTGYKIKNSTTDNPVNGYVDYQLTSTNPVATQGLYFQADKGTEVEVLKTGNWTLKWQYDGNLVLYQTGVAKWASNTNNKGTALRFQGDGNLVIYNNGVAVWNSATANNQQGGKGGRYLVLTSEGHLFILNQDNQVVWQGR